MCDKDFLENGGTLNFVPECYKNQEICNKAGDNYPHALVFVTDAIILKKCVIKLLIFIIINTTCFWML